MADRYEIKGRLGRGGVGAVYQAFDHHLERDVAIKRLLPIEDTKLNESAQNSLISEAGALASFSHPNIVTIFEFGRDQNGYFVVFELVEGDTLKEVISQGALSEADFYAVASQILDALVAAQDLNLLHRDIKPANIMLSWLPSGKFQIKMLDFGLSKFSQEPSMQTLDQKGSFLGSIDYIAPEQIELLPLDQRTDLYSLGCVLYFSLTQRAPFTGENMAETMNNHLKGEAIPLEDLRPDMPIAVCRWVMSLISLFPADRPDDALSAMRLLKEARDVGDDSSVEKDPGAKLVVPVVEAARPMPSKDLEQTGHIVSVPSPTRPERSNRVNSKSGSRAAKGSVEAHHRTTMFSATNVVGFVMGIVALIVVVSLVLASNRPEKETAKAQEMSILAERAAPNSGSAVETDLKEIRNVETITRSFKNSDLTADVPELPAQDSLIAYYSVLGRIQNIEGEPFDFNREWESIGAIENAAPGVHPLHLVRRPDRNGRPPMVTNSWSGLRTLLFRPGEKLVAYQRETTAKAITSNHYTIAFALKLPGEGSGSLFRLAVADQSGEYRDQALKMGFFKEAVQVFNDRSDTIKIGVASKRYLIVMMEVNTDRQFVSIWHRPKQADGKLIGGGSIYFSLQGPLNLKNYEFGNLIVPKTVTDRRRVEIAAMSIHASLLSESDRNSLGVKLLESLRKP